MGKFKQGNIELRDGQKLILDTAKGQWITADGSEATINTPLIGVAPTEDDHLTRKDYVDTEIATEIAAIPAIDSIDLDEDCDGDHSVSGLTSGMTVGEAVVFGQPLYMKSDGKLWKADATDDTKMPAIAMAAATISADASGSVLLQGFVRDDSWSWVVGGLIYASTTTGELTQTAPSTTGDQVQVVGTAIHAERMWFCPTPITSEIT